MSGFESMVAEPSSQMESDGQGRVVTLLQGRGGQTGNTSPARTISSRAIFGADVQVGIEHRGEVYLLQITRQGKLILTK